ncbi:MAG TPA: DMT family transporter [Actinotalea sp.]|nr:DMT family transporter [Actinotalea sp.]
MGVPDDAPGPGSPVPREHARIVPASLVAATIGALIAFQGRLNGDLAAGGAGPLVASWLSYLGTLGTVVVWLVARGAAGRTLRTLRGRGRRWWFALGVLGIPIVLAMAAGVPVVGIAIASVAAVAGQTVSGLALDARGVGVVAPLGLDARRVAAGLVAVGGLALAVLAGTGGLDVGLATVLVLGLLLFVGGLSIAGQQAGSGAITAITRDPAVAGLTTAIGGTLVMSALVGGGWAIGWLDGMQLPSEWYLYLGGPLGAGITVGAAWAVRHLGTFALTLATVGGQMATAITIDLVAGEGVHGATVAAAVLIVGATLATVRRPGRARVRRPGRAAR